MSEGIVKEPFADVSEIISNIDRIERYAERIRTKTTVTVSTSSISINIMEKFHCFHSPEAFDAFVNGFEVAYLIHVRLNRMPKTK